MIGYLLADDEQRLMAENARQILENDLAARVHDFEIEDEGIGAYPIDIHNILAEAGYCGLNVPEEWGGLGLGPLTCALIVEQMANVEAGFALAFYNSGSLFPLVEKSAFTKERKEELAEKITCGEIGALCVNEAESGAELSDMQTAAELNGEEWVINGAKSFVMNAPAASYYIVAAWTDKSKPASEGMSLFFVEKCDGVELGEKDNKMGLKLAETSSVTFNNVRVSKECLIGEEGQAATLLAEFDNSQKMITAAANVGIAQAVIENAVDYTKGRKQFGKRLCDHEGLGFLLAEMQEKVDVSRNSIYQILQYEEAGQTSKSLASSVRLFVAESTMQTALDGVQALGGYGYVKDFPMEKFMRDSKVFCILSGTTESQKQIILKSMVG